MMRKKRDEEGPRTLETEEGRHLDLPAPSIPIAFLKSLNQGGVHYEEENI